VSHMAENEPPAAPQDETPAAQAAHAAQAADDEAAEAQSAGQPGQPEPAGQDKKDDLPPVEVHVEELGALRKKLTITIPPERIHAKRDESIQQLLHSAQVPGFRVGRAPRRLIEKRFGPEVKQDVKGAMIGLGYTEALEKSKLKVLGEPIMDDAKFEAITVPEDGPMTFDVEVEIQPDFELPPLDGIPVTRPLAGVTDADVAGAMENWRANFATQEPVAGPAAIDDILSADLTVQIEGEEKHEHPGVNVAVRPQAIDGVPLENLGVQLTGATAGQTVTAETTIPAGHPNEKLRGKKAAYTFAVRHVKRTKLPELDGAFIGRFGFDNLDQMRTWMRDRLHMQSEQNQRQQMRRQVYDYLLGKVNLELPEGTLARMKDRTLARRANELMMQGAPKAEIEKHIDELAVHAGEEAKTELKSLFILQRVAEHLKVTVTEPEVNALISAMAAQYNRRPDNLRDELEKKNSMGQLHQQILEQKAVDLLLSRAIIVDAEPAERGNP